MLEFIKKIALFSLGIVAAIFAANNRAAAKLSLWPFGVDITMPTYLFTICAIFFGVVIGLLIPRKK